MSLPGDGDRLELTYNCDVPEGGYDVGTGYGYIALAVDDLDATPTARRATRRSGALDRSIPTRAFAEPTDLIRRPPSLPWRGDTARRKLRPQTTCKHGLTTPH